MGEARQNCGPNRNGLAVTLMKGMILLAVMTSCIVLVSTANSMNRLPMLADVTLATPKQGVDVFVGSITDPVQRGQVNCRHTNND